MDKFRFSVQNSGKATDELVQKVHRINAPCRIVMTLRKLETMLSSLKLTMPCMMRSNVMYQITSVQQPDICEFASQITSQKRAPRPAKKHIRQCGISLRDENVKILGYNI